MNKRVIPIIIPSYEPNDNLVFLVKELIDKKVDPIIIVNDGSDAKYVSFYDKVKLCGCILLKHETNRGKGSALKTAFRYCLDNFHDLYGVITADSDGQHKVADIIKCRNAIENNTLILGARDFDDDKVPFKSKFGNVLTRKIFRRLYKKEIKDTQTGLRGITKDFMQVLIRISGDRFEFETKMLIEAVERNISIIEIPIDTVYDSKENHSTHFNPVKDSIKIYSLFFGTFMKFIISSLSSCVIDLALFQVFCNLLRNRQLKINYIFISVVFARIISAIYNYLINYHFVFHSKTKYSSSLLKYILLAIVQMSCSAILTAIFGNIIHSSLEVLIKAPIDIALFFISYIIQRRYVYK